MIIGVIGGSRCSRKVAKLAEEVGRELAMHDVILICGGLGGVMEAACLGVKEAGGRTIGILPGNSATTANPYIDIPIVTGMGEARNVIIIKSAQAVIALDGEFGTLSEIAYALRGGVPVIGLGTWSLSKEGKPVDSIIIAEDAKDAVQKALVAANHHV